MYLRFVAVLIVISFSLILIGCGGETKEKFEVPGLDIKIKDVSAKKITYVEVIGPYEEIGDDFETFVGWSMQNVPQGIMSIFMGIYYDNPSVKPPEELKAEIACNVPPDYEGNDEHPVRDLPDMTVASVTLQGPYGEIAQRYTEIYGWIAQHEYSVAGPLYEVYIKAGPDVPESEYLTEIQIPVQKIEAQH
ncbi:MAG: GyrI-like domain-containing protein [candidate division Zixibacteria bacterium]|nr:GyrI-like domain-containing protein [candidate division Zixibacteria bacterium]